MKEDFLNYIWQNQKFDFANLTTSQGQTLQIIHQGNFIQQAGPDFFNAQIILDNQKWAGNIEIHVKASDWYLHHHETDKNYDNVILHVVWDYDIDVYRKDNSIIPVLELKDKVDITLLQQYKNLLQKKSWINCENSIKNVPDVIIQNWIERLFFERLERKTSVVNELLQTNQNHWEATLFCMLAKNFGLNINGQVFFELAQSIPFHVLQKESFDLHYLEALLLGQAGLIPEKPTNNYVKNLSETYQYIQIKYQLIQPILTIQFYKLRPDNFPTIRLVQLAALYHKHKNLFAKIMEAKSLQEIYAIFSISVSEFWETHYNFEKQSNRKEKSLSKSFVDLVIINTILPLKYAYNKFNNIDSQEEFYMLLEHITAEKNAITNHFKEYQLDIKNAFQSQAYIHLYNEYCLKNRCMQCAIGNCILKDSN